MCKKIGFFLLICAFVFMPPYDASLLAAQAIRCFDLGGRGLKTAIVVYDANTKTMTLTSPVLLLGQCPDHMQVSSWVRKQMRSVASADLDKEIRSGYLFGFSLAELQKLRCKAVPTSDVSQLFKIPSHLVGSIDDGGAHLLASLKALNLKLPKGNIWNFSLGTGVGFGLTNAEHEPRPYKDLILFFKQEPWTVREPLTKQCIWLTGGSTGGFDRILLSQQGVKKKAFEIFASRWKAFIDQEIIKRSLDSEKSWGAPAAFVFTGGHIEHHGDGLIQALMAQGLALPVFNGPKNAGILGAAWHVIHAKSKE